MTDAPASFVLHPPPPRESQMEDEVDDDALLAEAGPETEAQQALYLNLDETQPPLNQQQQSQQAPQPPPQQQQRHPPVPPPPQPQQQRKEDDFDMGIGEDELDEFLNEQQQQATDADGVVDDSMLPDDAPPAQPPKPSGAPPQLPRQQANQQRPAAAAGASTSAAPPSQQQQQQPKRAGTSATEPPSQPPKRPRTDHDHHAHASTSTAVEAGAHPPDPLDYLFDDGEEVQPTAPAAHAHAESSAQALSAVGVGSAGPAAPQPRLAPAYEPPRFMASQVEGDCIPVTTESGLRVYCKVHPQRQHKSSSSTWGGSSGVQGRGVLPGGFSLLAKPVWKMRQELEDVRMSQLMAEARNDAEERHAEGEAPSPRTPPRHASSSQTPGGSLWVNKYAPQSFMSLLSDEQTNRAVAKWVKSWDPCVFGTGTGPSLQGQQQRNQQGRAGGSRGAGGKQGAKGGGKGASDGRPEYKAILLTGPPGLGKTTLAHVVARHCGYHPFEINASDDRTAASLTQRVTDAAQMKPVLGSRKPNCVIIDEIDGATGGAEGHSAISALVKIITAGSKQQQPAQQEEEEGEDQEGRAGKQQGAKDKKGRGLPPLSRPLICIANDLYAPALRPLREVAEIFQFKEPNVEKLVSRLHHICNMEHVRVDKAALYALVQRAGVDIRSCLNTLQLLAKQAASMQRPGRPAAGRPPPYIKAKQVEQLNIGIKDTTKGVFAVWDELLHLPGRGGVGALRLPTGGGDKGGQGSRIQALYGALQDFGEHELVMAGLHENIHNVHYLDVHMRKTCELLEALTEADTMISTARRTLNHQLLNYVPASALSIHLSAAQQEKPVISWPKPMGDTSRRAQANLELMRGWATHKVAPRVLHAYDMRSLVTEAGPALIRVLSPSLRAMAPHLLTPAEHATIKHTTEVMVSFGLSYSLEDSQQAAAKAQQQQGPKRFDLAALLNSNTPAPPPRPVPLVPPIDNVVHDYPLAPHTTSGMPAPHTIPKRAARGGGAVAAALAAAAGEDEHVRAEPVRPVPLVLRQMLNQQVLLANIRRAEAHSGQVPDAFTTPGASGKENTPGAGHTAREGAHMPDVRQPSFMDVDEPQQQQQQQQKQQQAAKAEGKPLAPVNWLTSLRNNMSNKRKHQQQQQQRATKGRTEGDAAGSPSTPSMKAGKPQFAKLYRFNEGYTNAVKRPLLMKDLL